MIRPKVLMIGKLPTDLLSVKGGVEAAILNLFNGFSSLNDVDVVNVSFLEGISHRFQIDYTSNIKIIFLPYKIKIKLLDFLVNKPALTEILDQEKPDIVHIQESGPHLLRFVGRSKRNIVVTQHGIMKEELKYASGIGNKLKFIFKMLVERFVFPSFSNVIFISDYNRKLYQGKLSRSTSIWNAVNPVFFENSNPDIINGNSIIYVGVINKRKNLKLVIEALHELKLSNIRFDLHVVGWYKEGDVHYEMEISNLIEKFDLGSQITFYGWMKQQDILEVYQKCNFFILPSLQETLPVSIAEAMALGKIVIASDVGAISEMFENKVTGFLFGRNNLKELVNLLADLYKHPLPEGRSEEVRSVARNRYHPLNIATQTLEFYKAVLTDSVKNRN